jgi:hypothetical protein
MSYNDDDSPPAVGYRRPPRHSQFKKGQSGNPKGRPKRKAVDIGEILGDQVPIRQGDKIRKMSAFEAATRKLVGGAIRKRDLAACLEFVKVCAQYDIAVAPAVSRQSSVFWIPYSWNREEWLEMFEQYGPPPWPGGRSGLSDL